MAHRFRFFVSARGEEGATVALADADAAHLRVLRAGPGTAVEVVDAAGVLWAASVVDERSLRLAGASAAGEESPRIVLYAGALSGQAWDTLVDGAVQAGVSRIVPVVGSSREAGRVEARAARGARVAAAAARQAKRLAVPELGEPVRWDDVAAVQPGVVLVPRSGASLVDVALPGAPDEREMRLLVGGAEGLEEALVARLVGAGWQPAHLGATVLRSELAAAVAVCVLAQRLRRPAA